MIQEIAPHSLHNEYRPCAPEDDDIVFAFIIKGAMVMLYCSEKDGSKLMVPKVSDYRMNAPERLPSLLWLFKLDEISVFLDPAPDKSPLPGYAWHTTRLFRSGLPRELSYAGATAWHLNIWYMTNRFCGRCGAETKPDLNERAMRCPVCGMMIYPRVNPAVIIGVTNKDRIILTRYADGHSSSVYNTSGNTYRGRSLIAGYCEIGETIEETVAREVMEEVGLKVTNIHYYRSQPWGFDGALLLGFFCETDGTDEIRRDSSELSEARWYSREEIGEVEGTASLTNEMIRQFRDGLKMC